MELEQQTFDTMSAGDERPMSHARPGVRGSLDWRANEEWALGLSAYFGGTWLDWTEPIFNTAGNIEDVSWDTRLGLDRMFPLGGSGTVFIGAGFEYGEARSWVRTLGRVPGIPGGQDISDEGPHVFRRGGYARLRAMTPVWRRIGISAQVSESFYSAHAVDPTFLTRFSWMGRSLGVAVGLTFDIGEGRKADR